MSCVSGDDVLITVFVATILVVIAFFAGLLQVKEEEEKDNINQIEDMYNIFYSLGIKKWRLLCVDPIGRAASNKNFLLDKNQIAWLLNFIKQKRKEKSKMSYNFVRKPKYFNQRINKNSLQNK